MENRREQEPRLVSGMLPLALFDLGSSKGIAREALAVEADIDPSTGLDERVPLSSVLSLWTALISRFPSDPLGLELAVRWRSESLGLLGYLTSNARTLGEALDRFVEFQSLVDGESRLSRRVEGDLLIVNLARDPVLEALRQPMEGLLASGHAFFELLSQTRLVALHASAAHRTTLPPGPYRAFFGVDVAFGAERNELQYPASILDRPIPKADPRLGDYLLEAAESARIRFAEARALSSEALYERVAREVRRRLALGETLSIEPIAKQLGASPRTLQRALTTEGSSFREIADSERQRVAELLLGSSKHAVSEVAAQLGFSELASFSRAFKRWTGSSPAEFRRRTSR
ncbi:MAG: AraC family transcriptional regulator ligand-binding domain-containing protein [Polyangiaceae bacterium]